MIDYRSLFNGNLQEGRPYIKVCNDYTKLPFDWKYSNAAVSQ